MFFYLFYNSSLIGKQNDPQKNISTLIYGSIIYIIVHSLLFFKHNNDFVTNLQKYFWILFTLDCISVLFTFISKKDTLIFKNSLNFNKTPNTSEKIKNNNIKNKIKENVTKLKGIIKNENSTNSKIDKKRVSFEKDENKSENYDTLSQTSCSDYDLDDFENSLVSSKHE